MKISKSVFIFITVFITIVTNIIIFSSRSIRVCCPDSINCATTDFETLKKICLERLDDVGGIFEPVIESQKKVLKSAFKNCSLTNGGYKKLQALSSLIPYTSKGLEGVKPLEYPLQRYNPFQFEVGTAGWYWSYATFKEANVCATYMIVRLELGNKNVRKKFDLNLGSTTLYLCAWGIGGGKKDWESNKKDWESNDLTILPGKYEADYTTGNFKIVCDDQNKKETYTLKFSDNEYTFTYLNNSGKGIKCITIKSTVVKPGCINGKNGCVPSCKSGIGTDYWSYPQLQCMMQKDKENFKDGVGWMDRQWIKPGDPQNVLLKSVTNIAYHFARHKVNPTGLGKYVWITIHDNNNTQYMVYAAINNIDIEKNIDITKQAKVIKYSPDGKCTNTLKVDQLKITDVMMMTDNTSTVYPTKYTVQLENRTYNVDGTKYTGNQPGTIFDQSGNQHWAASAGLADSNGNSTGSAFIEASMMQPEKEYQNTTFKLAGIDTQDVDIWTARTTFKSALPSIIVLVLFLMLNIFTLYKFTEFIILLISSGSGRKNGRIKN
jgi:hypothetical protein